MKLDKRLGIKHTIYTQNEVMFIENEYNEGFYKEYFSYYYNLHRRYFVLGNY